MSVLKEQQYTRLYTNHWTGLLDSFYNWKFYTITTFWSSFVHLYETRSVCLMFWLLVIQQPTLRSCTLCSVCCECLTLKPASSFFKIRFIIHVLKNACWLPACLILWAFTICETKVYEISFLLV